jgi:hypothetical protein
MASQNAPKAIIRAGTSADLKELTQMLTRAFARDPMMNWFGGVRKLVSSADTQDRRERDTLKRLSRFEEATTRLVLLHGQIDVVVIPDGAGGEHIVASTMWIQPGRAMEPTKIEMLKLRADKIARAWGLGLFKVNIRHRCYVLCEAGLTAARRNSSVCTFQK